MNRPIRSSFRAAMCAAAVVLLGAASRSAAPAYYSHSEYYSDGSYMNQVGGWVSCPPEEGGYYSWGQRTSYVIHTYDDYTVCGIAEPE